MFKKIIISLMFFLPVACFASGNILITGASGGSGGGGASTLAVGTGTASNFTTNVTSPTAAISFLGSQFLSSANGTTNFVSLNPSSATLQGVLIAGTNVTLTPGTGTTTIAATSSSGGMSTLGVATGSLAGFTNVISSPTAVINFSSDTFSGQLRGGSTAFITLNVASVTLQGSLVAGSNVTLTPSAGRTTISSTDTGLTTINQLTSGATNFIYNTQTLQSGATFYVSSGTVTGTLTAGTFSGSGASLTSLPAGQLTGTVPNSTLDSSSVTKQGVLIAGTNITLTPGTGTTTIASTASGGSSSLAIATGSLSGFTGTISSPTAVINFSSDTFNGQLRGGSTAFITLNPSSVTLQGVFLAGTNITLTPGAGITTIASTASGGVAGSTGAIGISIDGGGSAIVAGSTRSITIPYASTISSWTVVSDASGSIAVHVSSSTYGNYPTLSNMVGTGNGPSLSSAQKNSATPSGWNGTAIAQGTILSFVVDSAATVKWVNIVLWVIKS